MGNDGGSIARRDEVVKVKSAPGKTDPLQARRVKWTTCRLSGKPLREPVVADGLGRMYNKEAIVNWLVEKKVSQAKGQPTADAGLAHIKGLKDLTQLQLHPNPAYVADATSRKAMSSSEDDLNASTPFACPLSGRPMNGTQRFVYIRTSGVVLSESALKAVLPVAGPSSTATASTRQAVCPITSTPFEPGTLVGRGGVKSASSSSSSSTQQSALSQVGDVIPLNPSGEAEEELLRLAMAQRKEAQKTVSAKNKKKSNETSQSEVASDAAATARLAEEHDAGPDQKRRKRSETDTNGREDEKRPAKSATATVSTGHSTVPVARAADPDQCLSPPPLSSTGAAAARIARMAAEQAKSKEAPLSASTLRSIYGKSS